MLATIDQVKTHIGLSGTTYDSVLTQILTQVDRMIKTELKREIEETTYTEQIFDGGDRYIQLNDMPLSSTEDFTFEYNKGDSEDPDWETVPRDDYELYYDEGVVYLHYPYFGKRVLKMTYTVGGDVPEDLEMLAIRLTAKIYNKRKSEGTSNESLENVSFGWQDLLSSEDKLIIENNRLKFII